MSPENTTHITVLFISADPQHPVSADPLRLGKLVQEATEASEGRLLKTLGDQFLCIFSTPEHAAQTSGRLFEAELNGIRAGDGLAMAVHKGYVVVGPDDVFGQAVVTAARMVAHARNGQTLISATALDRLSAVYRAASRACERLVLKGLDDPVDIHELVWDQQAATLMSPDIASRSAPDTQQMTLEHGPMRLILDHDKHTITVGRSSSADLTVEEELASRHHAIFEFRQSHFYLRDQSTNGTFLHIGRQQRFLRRDEIPITGSGQVRLGRPFDGSNPGTEIRFEVHRF